MVMIPAARPLGDITPGHYVPAMQRVLRHAPTPQQRLRGSDVLIYADSDDLTAGDTPWLSVAPTNAGSLLRSASLIVSRETKAAFYDSDTDGYPTNTVVREAFRQATCAQVTGWVTLGIDPMSLGLDGKAPVRSKQLDGAAIGYDTSIATSAAVLASRQAAAASLNDQAAEILREAGVLSTRVWGYG